MTEARKTSLLINRLPCGRELRVDTVDSPWNVNGTRAVSLSVNGTEALFTADDARAIAAALNNAAAEVDRVEDRLVRELRLRREASAIKHLWRMKL